MKTRNNGSFFPLVSVSVLWGLNPNVKKCEEELDGTCVYHTFSIVYLLSGSALDEKSESLIKEKIWSNNCQHLKWNWVLQHFFGTDHDHGQKNRSTHSKWVVWAQNKSHSLNSAPVFYFLTSLPNWEVDNSWYFMSRG